MKVIDDDGAELLRCEYCDKRKLSQKVWAVIDAKYGVVGLYANKRLATEACDEGIGLDSGYVGTVRSMTVRKSIKA